MNRANHTINHTRQDDLTALFACLADCNRRRALGFLHAAAPDALTPDKLATRLAQSGPQYHESYDTVAEARTAVYHIHVPALEVAGLIERSPESGTVAITDHAAFEDSGIITAISPGEAGETASWDTLFGALADARRRTILDTLSHQFHPIHRETLAREVAARERDMPESDVPEGVVQEVLVRLHHVHLPILADAGLLMDDTAPEMVGYDDHPELCVPWMHSVLEPNFRASLTGESSPQEIGNIEGREQVISYGQSLGDQAEEELFCMFTHKDMLEAGCFTRIIDAARRGVDVYIGTYDPTVREFVQEHAPEVSLWEPTRDWLNLPVEGNRVGRLLMADRETVMLGTLKEATEGEMIPEEKAIIGEGPDNTLVIMIRQMLQAHLDQIDDQTEETEPNLRF